jgi:acyl-CoA dehydrogenase
VVDWAIQLFGAAGVSQVFPLAYFAATARTMRILDGPDEVHLRTVARKELAQAKRRAGANAAQLRRWMPARMQN